ncbi:MAG: acetyl-CoA carboxylase biotin carboxyl carrier protein subunit [Lentimicrobiaceae bacterium]|jgi:biotin carboxyl carrier protein|nr:acetyl-CoA carboxylase biotin carboxyl carrier protein subunit [Lentimicrobiaceae bacterium]MBT3455408.1 acetyl-CoA carboxylase biotin carboxyl carrier protein subunit [Lentimicrobiaceae bacterium]MBT3818752.1 acetyl-CoA carboxylase biotin carboxyl carrier protein subunit [Lentimicrobiaceae bacterium]MBT4062019.1 acetyl-CoA carboxylase biotin carboxyl carrier protein subunit [Lentimicrobiaceae bacterium]MBT4190849.1 acetyl-CoA carboxylase biotin carboxyl carrier protein subunit [Lentimicrobi
MKYEIKVGDKVSDIRLISKEGNTAEVAIGDQIYKVDIVEVEQGIYSLLYDGISYNIELTTNNKKDYKATTLYDSFDVEIIDAETRYKNSRKSSEDDDHAFISTPMPGKIVKILVKEGDKVKGGDTVVVVSAMKMESEYKVVKDRTITKVLVKEGDNIEGDQPLIMLD